MSGSPNPDWIPGVQPEGAGRPKREFAKTNASPSAIAKEWREQELLRLVIEGYTIREGALIIGCNYNTAMSYARQPEWRTQLMTLRSSALGKLDEELIRSLRTKSDLMDELATLALEEMKKLLMDPDTHVGIKAKMIDSALDRTPEVSRTKKLDVTTKSFSMTGEDLLAAAMAAREIEDRQKMKEAEDAAKADNQQNMVRD